MRPLTLTTPKPLLQVGGRSLLEHHLLRLRAAGFRQIVINIAYLGHQIKAAFGDGREFGLAIFYSEEPEPLETGGALLRALPLLGDEPFALVNGDIWSDYPMSQLSQLELHSVGAHLVLVDNPQHNQRGDFVIDTSQNLHWSDVQQDAQTLTYSGMGVIHPELLRRYPDRREKFALREVFDWAIKQECLSGEHFRGQWWDLGTPERLEQLDQQLSRVDSQ